MDRLRNDPIRFQAKVDSMQRSCERIAKIISGLKKFSGSAVASEMTEFSLGAIVKEAMILLEPKLARTNCQIIFEIEEDCIVHCNEIEIEQVIVNLVSNAAEAIKNCEMKWIKISIFGGADTVVLQVSDSGPGIPENIRRKLFDPFFTTKRVGEGPGLGLSISKVILDEHKATISILEKTTNTCFEIRFPRVVKNAKSA